MSWGHQRARRAGRHRHVLTGDRVRGSGPHHQGEGGPWGGGAAIHWEGRVGNKKEWQK